MYKQIDDKMRAAYALNLCTVSVAQIVDYNDINIMEQEYESILNNLNLEQMPKDRALLDILKKILDTITYFRIAEGDKKMIDTEYQHQMKNAIWSAIPSVGAIFTTANPVAMGITLATQVGIGYMNYRRNRASYQLGREKEYWQLQRGAIDQLNGLQKELFSTAWALSKEYDFPDQYRLTEKQIHEYNAILMEQNPMKRYNRLNTIRDQFVAYPQFWYQIGSTANSIYRDKKYATDPDILGVFKSRAVEGFEKYYELNQANMLRCDTLTSSWALEYLELQDLYSSNRGKARELIQLAEKYSGKAPDVLELCAFAYLRLSDYDNATRVFHILVNEGYNPIVNTQVLSALYIMAMRSDDSDKAAKARVEYKLLPHITDQQFILSIPDHKIALSQWNPNWIQSKTAEEITLEDKKQQQQIAQQKETRRRKARDFFQKPIKIIYNKSLEDEAEYLLGFLNDNKNKVDPNLPSPSRCDISQYAKRREEFERQGAHVILIGDSPEAKRLYKNRRWKYSNLGMSYMSYGNKTVLLTRKLKNDQLDDFIELAANISKEHKVYVPANVESVKFSFLKEIYSGEFDDVINGFAAIVATIIGSPLIVLGQTMEFLANSIQGVTNLSAQQKLNFSQYCILFYNYLESESAIID